MDLELATGHYHGPALQAKAEAGFKMYAADDSASRLKGFERYLIFYRPLADGAEILRVIHGARDIERLFQ